MMAVSIFVENSRRYSQLKVCHVANLPPVSTTLGKMVAKFAAGVVDTGGKFAAGVVDIGGNLPLVSLIPVVHLGLRISP
jgi:hypothetical protein